MAAGRALSNSVVAAAHRPEREAQQRARAWELLLRCTPSVWSMDWRSSLSGDSSSASGRAAGCQLRASSAGSSEPAVEVALQRGCHSRLLALASSKLGRLHGRRQTAVSQGARCPAPADAAPLPPARTPHLTDACAQVINPNVDDQLKEMQQVRSLAPRTCPLSSLSPRELVAHPRCAVCRA